MTVKSLIRPFVPKTLRELRNLLQRTRPVCQRHCSICNYYGFFSNFGRPPRLDAVCPKCGSLERHRLFWLWFQGDPRKLNEPILHFAPEQILEKNFRRIYKNYKSADLFDKADLKLNIEEIDMPSGSVNTVICNHVLEHVNDRRALAELNRILSADGRLVVSVPIVEGWDRTYENSSVTDPVLRDLHFGQFDHVRFYGRDFRDRLRDAGFSRIEEITAEGSDVIEYGLLRGDKFFVCGKS
jgi:SAM-dependent methyltransferase